jgi:hypothetical protein
MSLLRVGLECVAAECSFFCHKLTLPHCIPRNCNGTRPNIKLTIQIGQPIGIGRVNEKDKEKKIRRGKATCPRTWLRGGKAKKCRRKMMCRGRGVRGQMCDRDAETQGLWRYSNVRGQSQAVNMNIYEGNENWFVSFSFCR